MSETSGAPHGQLPQEAQPAAPLQPAATERTFADHLNGVEDPLDREYALQHAENSHDENLRAQAAAYREAHGMPASVEPTPLPPPPKHLYTVSDAGRKLLEQEMAPIADRLGMRGREEEVAQHIAHLGISRQSWPGLLARTSVHERDQFDAIRKELLTTAVTYGMDKGFYNESYTSAKGQLYGSGGQIRVVRSAPAAQSAEAAKTPVEQPAPAPKAEQPTAQAKPTPVTQPEAAPAAQPAQPQAAEAGKKAPEKTVVHAYVPTRERVEAANAFLANLGRRPDGMLTEEAMGELTALQRDEPLTAEVITDGFSAAQRNLFRDYQNAHPLPKEGRRLFGRKKK